MPQFLRVKKIMSNEYSIKLRRKYESEIEPDQLFRKFQSSYDQNPKSVLIRVVKPNIFLKIDESERHYWSPEMSITIEEQENKTQVREVIGPNPAVFTLTMFLIFFAGTLFLFTLMFLFSQMTLKMDTSITWVIIGICFILFAIISLFMFYGRIKAKPQMLIMQDYVKKVMNT